MDGEGGGGGGGVIGVMRLGGVGDWGCGREIVALPHSHTKPIGTR